MRAPMFVVLSAFAPVLAGLPSAANAKGGSGSGKTCKPGMTFNSCYERCGQRYGSMTEIEMGKCAKKCSKRGCVCTSNV
jgi:hypothetical protein